MGKEEVAAREKKTARADGGKSRGEEWGPPATGAGREAELRRPWESVEAECRRKWACPAAPPHP